MKEKILFVDDEANILKALQRLLRGDFTLDIANNIQEAFRLMSKTEYAVIVTDMDMPDMDGLTFLSKTKELSPRSVRIMLTGSYYQRTAIDAINEGEVFKFLSKPCPEHTLREALTLALKEFQNRVHKEEQLDSALNNIDALEEKLNFEKEHDELTGLYYRRTFDLKINSFLSNIKQTKNKHTLIVLDIDHLTVINESCGHLAGDELISQVAILIKNKTRDSDILARLGGDEFGIFLVNMSIEKATDKIKEIQAQLSKHFFEWGDKQFNITISCGLAELNNNSNQQILNHTEALCTLAKNNGGNQIRVYHENDNDLTEYQSKLKSITKLKHALAEDRFQLFCQPIIPVTGSEQGQHYEILIRMLDEDGSILPPAEFLETAEYYHLSSKLDYWVINATFNWLDQNLPHIKGLAQCGINLSGQSLSDPNILDLILEKFNTVHFSPDKIYFEITESSAISNIMNAKLFISTLRNIGCCFALDDFGAGLSSFTYLKNFDVDYIKIDGSFVKNIHGDKTDFAIVKSITDIGHSMGKEIIAEYVENDLILNKLKSIDVDFAQGYGISKPFPLTELRLNHESDHAVSDLKYQQG